MRGEGQCLNGGMGLEPDEEGVAGWGQGAGGLGRPEAWEQGG